MNPLLIQTYVKLFDFEIKMPGAKIAIPYEIISKHPRDCKTCGGVGTLILYIGTEGPYEFPPSGAVRDDGGQIISNIIAKWANDKWWGGKSYEKKCPACHGLGIDASYKEPKRGPHILDISGVVKQTARVEEVSDE